MDQKFARRFLLAGASALAMLLAAEGADAVTFDFTGSLATWTVPVSGLYDIVAYGAQGGSAPIGFGGFMVGPRGAEAAGEVDLVAGTKLIILAGGVGGTPGGTYALNAGGGGGGSFVFEETSVLVAAGGGGGAAGFGTLEGGYGRGGSAGGSSPNGAQGAGAQNLGPPPPFIEYGGAQFLGGVYGGKGGTGGSDGSNGANSYGGGGASGGPAALASHRGGFGGGFGGGGGGAGNSIYGGGGGGGGGFSGGGGGGNYQFYYSDGSVGTVGGGGGGGGSYVAPSFINTIVKSDVNYGNGFVTIDLVAASVPEPSTWTMILAGFSALGAMLARRAKKPITPA